MRKGLLQMQLLGIEKVISAREAQPGRFYLQEQYNEDPVLMLCFLTGERVDNIPETKALYFQPNQDRKLAIHLMPTYEPIVELPKVHVRVDGLSLSATSTSSSIQSGMMLIAADVPLIVAPLEFRNWYLIDLNSGGVSQVDRAQPWAAFDRWQLIIEDAGEEVVIADFGA